MSKTVRSLIIAAAFPVLAVFLSAASAQAADSSGGASVTVAPVPTATWHAQTLGHAMLNCVAFAALGFALMLIGFKIFDRVITHIDIEKEIAKGNVAAAVLAGAVIISLSLIIVAAMS